VVADVGDESTESLSAPQLWASPGGGKTGISLPWELGLRSEISGKREIMNLIVIIWVNSCNDSLFADMTLTLHKTQVHCFDSMQL